MSHHRRFALAAVAALLAFVFPASAQEKAQELPEPPAGKSFLDWYGELALKRKTQIARLEEYARARKFPLNYLADDWSPVFRDPASKNFCAVAQLLVDDRQDKVVEDVVNGNNQVFIMNLKEGPVFDWILHSGLTQEECALIQPTYPPGSRERAAAEREKARVAELKRLETHFRNVVRQLKDETPESLETALRRLLPKIKVGADARNARGFFLKRPEPGSGATTLHVRCYAHDGFLARATFLDGQGGRKSSSPWTWLGKHLTVKEAPARSWLLVEWECQSWGELQRNPPAIIATYEEP